MPDADAEVRVTGTFRGTKAAELAVVERGGFVESRHLGSAAVVDAEGELLLDLGDARAPVLGRSTLKFLQALASQEAGAELHGEHLAIACASHAGTPLHIALVRDILGRAHLDERSLACPAAWPNDSASRDALIRANEPSASIYMECSGKHAAMLLACVASGWDTTTYLDPAHPLQRLIAQTIERFCGERIMATTVDGCGAPAHATSLAGLARSMSKFVTSQPGSPFGIFRHAAEIASEVRAHGWTIDGPGRPNAVVIDQLGVIAKTGAEGIMLMAAPDGTAVAIKILDGNGRAATLVGLQLLIAAGSVSAADAQRVVPELHLELFGAGRPVGAVRLGRDVPTAITR